MFTKVRGTKRRPWDYDSDFYDSIAEFSKVQEEVFLKKRRERFLSTYIHVEAQQSLNIYFYCHKH